MSGSPWVRPPAPEGRDRGEERRREGMLTEAATQSRSVQVPNLETPKWDKPGIVWSFQQTHWVANQSWVDIYLFIASHLSYVIWIFIHFIKEILIHLIPDATTYPVWVLCNLWKMPQITFREFKHSEFLSRMAPDFFLWGMEGECFPSQPVLLSFTEMIFPSFSEESK